MTYKCEVRIPSAMWVGLIERQRDERGPAQIVDPFARPRAAGPLRVADVAIGGVALAVALVRAQQ